MAQYTAEYMIYSDIDNGRDVVSTSVVQVDASNEEDAAERSERWVEDNDPKFDERLHPVVQIGTIVEDDGGAE